MPSWAAVGAGVAEAAGETPRLHRRGARTRGQADEPGRGSEALSPPDLLSAPGPGPRAELGARPCPLPGPVPTFLPAPPLAHPPPRPCRGRSSRPRPVVPPPDQPRPRPPRPRPPPPAWPPRRPELRWPCGCTAAELAASRCTDVRLAEHGAEVRAAQGHGQAGSGKSHGRGTGTRALS